MASIAPPPATPASTAPTATVAVASINEVATPLLSLSQFAIFLKGFISTPCNSYILLRPVIARSGPNRKSLKTIQNCPRRSRNLQISSRRESCVHQSSLISQQKARTFVRAGRSVRAGFGSLDSEHDVVAGSRKVVERLIDAGFDVPVRPS